MAWIRLERQCGTDGLRQQYDGICEDQDDLSDEETNGYAVYNGSHTELAAGSLAFCLEDGKLYVKASDMSWTAVTAASAAEEPGEDET